MKCAFSGHRAERFPWSKENEMGCVRLKERLRQEILRAFEEGYRYFLVGGATGVDTWAGELVLELKQDGYPCMALSM